MHCMWAIFEDPFIETKYRGKITHWDQLKETYLIIPETKTLATTAFLNTNVG